MAVPKGWEADAGLYSGMVILTAKDKTARMFTLDTVGAATDKNVQFWIKGGFAHQAKITLDPVTTGKYGKDHLDAQFNTGTGTLFGKPAKFWVVRFKLGSQPVLVEGGLTDGAPPERQRELFAAMQSVTMP